MYWLNNLQMAAREIATRQVWENDPPVIFSLAIVSDGSCAKQKYALELDVHSSTHYFYM